MERSRYFFISILCLFTSFSFGQYNQVFYQAFIDGNMNKWKVQIDSMQKSAQLNDDDLLDLVNHQIGYIGWCIGMKKYDEAKIYIHLSESILNELQNKNFKPSYVLSYKGSVSGLKIGLNTLYAFLLGPGIISKAKSSIQIDDENPYGYILLGNSKYYMWSTMGGSKEEAISYYKKAEKIIENKNQTNYNWNYLSLLTMIAHAYEQMNEYSDADLYYQKILRVEPNYKWIKEEIYPQFLAEYGGK